MKWYQEGATHGFFSYFVSRTFWSIQMLNRWAAKAFDPPETVQNIYCRGGPWVNLTICIEGSSDVFSIIENAKQIRK
jgi:hypothetical protein